MPLLSENESEQILELVNHIQPEIPWSMEHLRWQLFETPAGPARLYGMKDSQNKLVAFYAAIAQRVRIEGQILHARMIQDVMTHPDYRGRGFLHQLGEQCCHDMIQADEVGYTFPNEKSENSFRRIGWAELCSVPWRKKSLNVSLSCSSPLDISEINRFDDTASLLWDLSGLDVGVHRDASYLNWRYSKPATTYFKFLVSGAEGLIVLKLYGQTLHICELVTPRDRMGHIPAMLSFCDLFGRQHEAGALTAWLPKWHPYGPAFDQHGLVTVTGVSRYVFVHAGRRAAEKLTNPKLWHLTQGDSDIY